MEILQAAPAARVVTTFLGLGILSLEYRIPPDRIFLLTSDCFGAPLSTAEQALADDITAVPMTWSQQQLSATVDSPWVSGVERNAFRSSLQPLRQLDPSVVLCTHLPPAHAATARLLDTLESAPDADPFIGPDQAALEALLAEFEPAEG